VFSPSPDRNLLKVQGPRSLSSMALRALVFSSDGSTTSALCHVLTDLGIEAEICSEMLVAVERITTQSYAALLVDWDQQAEAIFLVKQLRELKLAAQALTLALVQNDQDLPQALQAGANSVIRKPIDPQQARDTLSTAKQLILARQFEPRTTEPRPSEVPSVAPVIVASSNNDSRPVAAPPAPVEGPFAIDDPDNFEHANDEQEPKRGFLLQTATRSAVDAEQFVASGEPVPPEPEPAPAASVPDPSVRERALSILGYGPKDESKAAPKDDTNNSRAIEDFAAPVPTRRREPRSQDLNHEFSSLPENFDEATDDASAPRANSALFAIAVVLLTGGIFWVFAPGGTYLALLKKLRVAVHPASAQNTATAIRRDVHPPTHSAAPSNEQVLPDPALIESQDEASSNIQVIENKPIPIAGAQQPPTSDAAPDAQPVNTADAPAGLEPTAATPAAVPAESTASTSHPQLQPTAATQVSSSSAPSAPVAVPLPPATTTPASSTIDPSASRPAVIIPDSLKNSPSAGSITTVEPPIIPEETSRAMLLKKVDPDYPPIAIPQRLEGTVILQAFVGADGAVRDIKLVRGYFLLGRAAFDAVRQWRFKPYSQNGKPVDFQTYITINFKLPS
jgi:TonB family protein